MTLLEKIIQDKDLNKITKIIKDLAPYDNYFNQNLMNKGEDNWNSDEFISYFHYFKFKLFLNYTYVNDNRQVEYYNSAIKIFTNIYEQLKKIYNISNYEKICAITSLYRRLNGDFNNKENIAYLIGEYTLLNMNDNKIKCYNLVYNFISKIIDNLKKNSFIFLSLYYKTSTNRIKRGRN